MERKFLWVWLGILALLLIAGAATLFVLRAEQHLRGSVIDPPITASDFALTGQSGQTVHLSDYRGKYVLLFFGYTNCTTECPATMAVLKLVRADLGSQAKDIQVLFISTDPARDTPQAVGAFLARFDPTFVGVTGSQADLAKVWSAYGVTVLDGGETHSTFVYLIDPQGNLRLTYPSVSSPDDIVADLKLLIRKG
jgi:protein SCO1/2